MEIRKLGFIIRISVKGFIRESVGKIKREIFYSLSRNQSRFTNIQKKVLFKFKKSFFQLNFFNSK